MNPVLRWARQEYVTAETVIDATPSGVIVIGRSVSRWLITIRLDQTLPFVVQFRSGNTALLDLYIPNGSNFIQFSEDTIGGIVTESVLMAPQGGNAQCVVSTCEYTPHRQKVLDEFTRRILSDSGAL